MIIDTTILYMLIGTGCLGIGAGVLGSFGILREQSLLGDAISHAAFPGIILAFLVTQSKNSLVLMIGGFIAGAMGALCVAAITNYSRLKKDTALGIVLSVFFGLGMTLLSHLQKKPIAAQAVLTKFIYGNAAAMLPQDLYMIIGVTIITLVTIALFFRPLALISFDQNYAQVMGYRQWGWDLLLTFLHIVIIIVGLQTVGVILISTLLIAPAAAARQWVTRLPAMVVVAGIFGAGATITGSLMSCLPLRLPTGPIIVIVLTVIVLVSILVAPGRGVLWRWRGL